MESEIIKFFISQGAWAVLFVLLFLDTRKENKTRELSYQKTIKDNQKIIAENQSVIMKLTEKLNIVECIRTDVEEIKEGLRAVKP